MNNDTSMNNEKQKRARHKQSQTQRNCSEVRATAPRPRLHHYEGFYYPLRLHHYEGFYYPLRDLPQRDLTQRNYYLVYTRPEYTTPPTQSSTQEVA